MLPIPQREMADRLILVVDDDDDNREVLSRMLSLLGYNTVTARTGREALNVAHNCEPALILMDMTMPEVDGWTATGQLRRAPDLRHIPIIAVTAHALEEPRRRAIEAGCNAYLTKPVDLDLLVGTVARFLS